MLESCGRARGVALLCAGLAVACDSRNTRNDASTDAASSPDSANDANDASSVDSAEATDGGAVLFDASGTTCSPDVTWARDAALPSADGDGGLGDPPALAVADPPGGWRWELGAHPYDSNSRVLAVSERESWFFRRGTAVRLLGGVFSAYAIPESSLNAGSYEPAMIWRDFEGAVWVWVRGLALVRFNGTQFVAAPIAVAPAGVSDRVLRASNGRFWIQNASGFHRWNGTSFDPPTTFPGRAVGVTDDGELVFLEGTSNIVRVPSGRRMQDVRLDAIGSPLALFAHGRSLFGIAGAGAAPTSQIHLDECTVELRNAQILLRNLPQSMSGARWYSTDDGRLCSLDTSGRIEAQLWTLQPEVPSNFDFHIPSRTGWIQASGDLLRIEQDARQRPSPHAASPMRYFGGAAGQPPSIALGKGIWAQRDASGAWTHSTYPFANPERLDWQSSESESADSVWALAADRPLLARWTRAGGLQAVTVPGAPGESLSVTALHVRGVNDVWIATEGSAGLALRHWDGATWSVQPLRLPTSSFAQPIRAIAIESSTVALVATYAPAFMFIRGGASVHRCASGACSLLLDRPGATTDAASRVSLVRDSAGGVWFSGLAVERLAPGATEFAAIPGVGGFAPVVRFGSGVAISTSVATSPSLGAIVHFDGATAARRTIAEGPAMLNAAGFWLESERSLYWGTTRGGLLRWAAP